MGSKSGLGAPFKALVENKIVFSNWSTAGFAVISRETDPLIFNSRIVKYFNMGPKHNGIPSLVNFTRSKRSGLPLKAFR